MFSPRKYNKALEYPLAAAGVTIVKGSALVDDGNGLLTNATDAATEVRYVAAESKVTVEGDKIACYYTEGIEFLADTDAAPAQTDVGTKADLATVSTINPNASTNDVFFIKEIYGPVANLKIVGEFVLKIA